MKKVIFLSMLLVFCMLAYGQTYRIEGTVIDKTSRKPLEFVNVLVVGLGIGSSTDAKGILASNRFRRESTVCRLPCWGTKRSLHPSIV